METIHLSFLDYIRHPVVQCVLYKANVLAQLFPLRHSYKYYGLLAGGYFHIYTENIEQGITLEYQIIYFDILHSPTTTNQPSTSKKHNMSHISALTDQILTKI